MSVDMDMDMDMDMDVDMPGLPTLDACATPAIDTPHVRFSIEPTATLCKSCAKRQTHDAVSLNETAVFLLNE
jgi:hypothetical protein